MVVKGFTNHTGQYGCARKRFAKWLFVPNTVLDDDDCSFLLLHSWNKLLRDRCLVNCFVGANDVVESRSSFRWGLHHYSPMSAVFYKCYLELRISTFIRRQFMLSVVFAGDSKAAGLYRIII
ncbi:hypothetical protein RRF57_004429 [Xylaria bambusicola]|uniref:Uncharacterized protein n=1 Tax=Xylaria bambusicola TaxID=326684 RepID=A0AAN7UW78_9PEZI